MHKLFLLGLSGLVGLATFAACTPTKTPSPDEAPTDCTLPFNHLIGTNVALLDLPADDMVRVIGPDTAVTLDYLPERANIHFGADGIITDIRCG